MTQRKRAASASKCGQGQHNCQVHTAVHGGDSGWGVSANILLQNVWHEMECKKKKASKLYCILQYKNPISYFLLHLAFLHHTVLSMKTLPSCQKKIPIIRKTAV